MVLTTHVKDGSKKPKFTPYEEREVEIPSKDEVRGHRNAKKRKKEYEKKYGSDYDNWN